MTKFGYPYNDLVICKDSTDYLGSYIPEIKYLYIYIYTGCAKKKKDILNIHIKSEGINIFSQKFYRTESTIFVVKCQKFTFIVQFFMT